MLYSQSQTRNRNRFLTMILIILFAVGLMGMQAAQPEEADAACSSVSPWMTGWYSGSTYVVQAVASFTNCNSVSSGESVCIQRSHDYSTFACRYGTNQWSHQGYSYQDNCYRDWNRYYANGQEYYRAYVYNYYTGAVSYSGWYQGDLAYFC